MATQNLPTQTAKSNTPNERIPTSIPDPRGPYLYRATGGGMADVESLRNNLEAIAESLRELAQGITNHAIDLESMMPEKSARKARKGVSS